MARLQRSGHPFKQLIVRPGYGSDELHLGQGQKQIREFLGRPDSITRKYKGQYFLNYDRLGIEVDIGKKDGPAKYLYFFREGVRNHRQAAVVTIDGLKPGDWRNKVPRTRGEPNERGEAFALSSGYYGREWMAYDDGIWFEFGRDHRIDWITIARRKARRKGEERR